MKTLTIVDLQHTADDLGKYVKFSDGKHYGVRLVMCGLNGWDCALRLLPSQRTVTSQLRRRMVLQHLGLESAVTRLEKSRAGLLRIKLKKYGYELQKSRVFRRPHAEDRGKYRVCDCNEGWAVVLGPHFDATLEQVDALLQEKIAESRQAHFSA